MASTSEAIVELEELLPTAILKQDDTGQNSETQLTTACIQERPTPSPQTTSQESGPNNLEPPKSSAFYKKTYTSGKLRFIKDNTHLSDAKFIKINADAGDSESIMQQVAEGVVNKLWRVHHKNILLSVTSGADELDEAGSEAFKEGIRHILPGTCIVTGGTNDGVTRLVGDAVHEFNNRAHYEEHDTNKCPTIGIVCLDRLGRNKDTIKPWELTRGVFGIDSDGELFTVDNRGER
ncbi:uncharacterized protein LOC127860772 [Dreissena polymorpha]|uniref:uncharacterized protein LOC127860772 n=1 Tax=Dreissena polymorpha TaxID=45954 RepID=UPI002263C667|nr:uncharacterized protein LOC127860772 [Dreissena polymorpha]